jgi:hypothetical protein
MCSVICMSAEGGSCNVLSCMLSTESMSCNMLDHTCQSKEGSVTFDHVYRESKTAL